MNVLHNTFESVNLQADRLSGSSQLQLRVLSLEIRSIEKIAKHSVSLIALPELKAVGGVLLLPGERTEYERPGSTPLSSTLVTDMANVRFLVTVARLGCFILVLDVQINCLNKKKKKEEKIDVE